MSNHYSQVPVNSRVQATSPGSNNYHDHIPAPTRERNLKAWASTVWPLVLHYIVATAIVALLISYVNGRQFNLTERRPLVPLPDGTTVQLDQYTPLQSDVNTFVSATLVILRLIATSWASSLCWRSVFFLLGRTGLLQRDLEWMISFGVFSPPAYFRHHLIFVVGIILLATLSAQVASPILTGSISWIPSSQLVELQSNPTVGFTSGADLSRWGGYLYYTPRREWTARQAAGLVSVAWGRSVEKDIMKRVVPSASGLNINSTIDKVTVPYFSVASLEWVSDPESLPQEQRNITNIGAVISTYNAMRPLVLGLGAFIPHTPWNNNTPVPHPHAITETRLIVMITHWQLDNGVEGCKPNSSTIFRALPSSMGHIEYEHDCYAFAWVTYSAGVAVCTDCRVSSYSTVQSDTPLSLQPDYMTHEALRLMADTTALLVQMNVSIPSSWGTDIDEYIIEVLSRSYSGTWSALTNYFGRDTPLTTNSTPALPSLQAQVDMSRVYVWFAIQILTTLSGVAFLAIQFKTKYELIGDTTLIAFELDTTEVTTEHGRKRLRAGEMLKLRPIDGRYKVVVEPTYAKS